MSVCTIKDFLDGLYCQLKDEDRVRWPEDYLQWVIEIAARQIQSDRKDLFKETHKIKLDVGCETLVCNQGCEDISGPFYQVGVDSECEEIQTISSDEDWISEYFPVVRCQSSSDEYIIDNIITDIENPCAIKVVPPVPDDGKSYWITAKCQRDISDDLASGNLPSAICKHLNAFTQLVLFYAYSKDSMVNVDMSQAQAYFERYLTLMQLTYMNDLSHREKTIYLQQLIDRSSIQGAS